jgi:hypothetical protein
MREYVDATWGWDDDEQIAFFGEHFDPARLQMQPWNGNGDHSGRGERSTLSSRP